MKVISHITHGRIVRKHTVVVIEVGARYAEDSFRPVTVIDEGAVGIACCHFVKGAAIVVDRNALNGSSIESEPSGGTIHKRARAGSGSTAGVNQARGGGASLAFTFRARACSHGAAEVSIRGEAINNEWVAEETWGESHHA